jgi:anthranilate synthase component I
MALATRILSKNIHIREFPILGVLPENKGRTIIMYETLSREEFEEAAKSHTRIVVFKEITFDHMTPVTAFHSVTQLYAKMCENGIALLESASPKEKESHLSVLAFDFESVFKATGERIETVLNGNVRQCRQGLFVAMREMLHQHGCYVKKKIAPAVGGAVGFVSYDFVRQIERIPDRHEKNECIDDVFLAFPRKVLVFDHRNKKLSLCLVTGNAMQDYDAAQAELSRLEESLQTILPFPKKAAPHISDIATEISDKEFCGLVDTAKEYLRKGDAFQIVLSRSFQMQIHSSPFTIYRALRNLNPSPFMFYLQTPSFILAGASPERLVRVQSKKIETMPIAGTRPRAADPDVDMGLELQLLQDPKENAEHMMLVDLGRNDVGRVAEIGSVKVSKLRKIEKYSHVMHIVSEVEGSLRNGLDSIDALKALFPASTLTGAPKIRAMEIIDQLEVSRRGLYGGAILMLNEEDLDSCIAIRMAFIQDKIATVRAGAGIVLDSDPEMETKETFHKASAILTAIQMAERGEL